MIAGCGGSDRPEVVSKQTLAQIKKAAKTQNTPLLKIVGNGGECSLESRKTFRFVGSGFKPGEKVMILVFAPTDWADPVYPNPQKFYWYHENFGVYKANSKGEVRSSPWECWEGPKGTQDPQGSYEVRALGWKSGKSSKLIRFHTVA